jgi:two-component system sensor histidine kinase KdpD
MATPGWRADVARAFASVGMIAGVTAMYFSWLGVTNPTTAALSFLLIILFVAASSRLWVAVVASVAAALSFDYFFLPPVDTFNIDDPQDWIALFAFIIVSLVASRLSAVARAREQELGRLFEFSRDAMLGNDADPLRSLAEHIAARFRLAYAAIYLPTDAGFARHEAGTLEAHANPSLDDLRRAASASRLGGNHIVVTARGRYPVSVVPLRHRTQATGVLIVAGRRLGPATLNALASVVAIASERAHLLEQRDRAEASRRSVEIKSALLASLSHDLRTPLTALHMAVSNLRVASLTESQRASQVDIALTGLDRLNRLFQNILEMARIDAGGITLSLEWVHPSEIIQAARSQVDHALRSHTLKVVEHMNDEVVNVDPRLLSTALAHLLENAAQYSPAASTITVTAELASGGFRFMVDDEGPGIAPEDLPRVFERFYRGAEAQRHASGTGMGLAIVQGLLNAQGGHVSVDSRPGHGARFSIFVPATTRVTIWPDRDDQTPRTDGRTPD